MIFSTDDFWCLDTMKKNASRMRVSICCESPSSPVGPVKTRLNFHFHQILSVYDLPRPEALRSLRYLRRMYRPRAAIDAGIPLESDQELESVLDLIGGRTSYMMRVARRTDMLGEMKKNDGGISLS